MDQERKQIPQLNNPLIRFIADKKFRWLRHASFILMGFILAFKGDIGVSTEFRSPELTREMIRVDVITYLFLMGVIYLIIEVLIPRLLFRSKYFLFAVSIGIIVTLIYFFVWWADVQFLLPLDRPNGPPQIQHVEFSLIAFIQLSAVSVVLLGAVIGMTIFKKWIIDVQQITELQQAGLRAELEQLKSQINPHFLFNTLNNLIVLIKTDQDKASQVLHGLSDLLRYLLYDGAQEEIVLSKDLSFIRNLLSLEKIRKNDFEYQIFSGPEINNLRLPPFIFIPFVENAIKHGAAAEGHSYLKLSFVLEENRLYFTAENSKPAIKSKTTGGLGLRNIRRRLELLFPGNYQLEIKEDNEKYLTRLILPV